MTALTSDFLFSRQPIVGEDRRFLAWELAFASSEGRRLSPSGDDSVAYGAALERLTATTSWDALLCGGRALVAMDRRMLFSDVMDHMPRNRVWIGLRSELDIDANVAARLHALHRARGTRLLLMDYHRRDPREEVLELADAVEINRDAEGGDLDLLTRRAQRRHLSVLARDIKTDGSFVEARDSGCRLFAGEHYAHAGKNAETAASGDGRVLLGLMLDAQVSLDVSTVSERITASETLAEGLLRLVNSLELARAQKIESVQQALIMVGAKGLARWLNLLLFQVGGPHGNLGPLFRVAASRARLMELLMSHDAADDPETKDRGEAAFLTGILSLVHVLLGEDRSSSIDSLKLEPTTRHAILDYRGEVGSILRLAECLDFGLFGEAAEIAADRGIEPAALWAHQCAAYEWVNQTL